MSSVQNIRAMPIHNDEAGLTSAEAVRLARASLDRIRQATFDRDCLAALLADIRRRRQSIGSKVVGGAPEALKADEAGHIVAFSLHL